MTDYEDTPEEIAEERITNLMRELDECKVRVEKELARHVCGIFRKQCRACGFPWPCPTVRILNGEE